MVQLALWVASALFLACCGLFLIGVIIRFCESVSGPIKYSPPDDENAERRAQVIINLKAKAGPRRDDESLQEYGQRLGIARL